MFKQISTFFCNIKPIYKIILIAFVIVIILGILLSIGFSNHYYTIKCRDDIEEYSSKLHHCTSEVFNQTEGFRRLELSLIQYNFTRLHSCDLGFKILKCLYGIYPVDDDCDEKPTAQRLTNVNKVSVETIQFFCIDSDLSYRLMEQSYLDECNSTSLMNYDNCITVQQQHQNVTELNSFLNRNLCRNFDIKMFCNQYLSTCLDLKLLDSVYKTLKVSFTCP